MRGQADGMQTELGLLIKLAAAKVGRYATSESGDTLELIERPKGGLSAVLVDGQTSGRGAKAVSNLVAQKVIALLGEGVRDGAAARAASDYLFTLRQGKVSADLIVLSVDLGTSTVVLSRNTSAPAVILEAGRIRTIDRATVPIGLHPRTKPGVVELPVQADLFVIAFTDGMLSAGRDKGKALDVAAEVQEWRGSGEPDPASLANALLDKAVALDEGRPSDDISVMVLGVVRNASGDTVRALTARMPI